MAHSTLDTQAQSDALSSAAGDSQLWHGVQRLLRPLASLKLTVVLFAMAIFIVLAGTFAQVDKDIWEVINGYFRIDFSSTTSALRTLFVWIDLQLFFPPSFFPSKPQVPGGFPFPSGWLIGIVMSINLITAHLLRFKIQARGGRLFGGLALIVAGVLVTAMVIASGSNKEGFQHASWIEWSTLWAVSKFGLLALWLGTLYGWSRMLQSPETERWLLILVGAVTGMLGLLLGWLLYQGDAAKLGDSSMRILWQLILGLLCGLVLLGGCVMIFKKRAGIVLLHSGILLMMVGEVLVGIGAVEGQMQIREGETVNFVQDLRSVELALVDSSDPEYDNVVVVPESILRRGGKIEHELLPYDVELVKFYDHSTVRAPKPGEENPATAGIGLRQIAVPARASTGTDMSGGVDLASAYVKFTKKDSSEALGTYLVSQWLLPDTLTEPFEEAPPDGWEAQPHPMGAALPAYRVERDAERADVTVTRLAGTAGGVEANLARWRGQIGLEPTGNNEDETRQIAVDGGSAVYVDLAGPEATGEARKRLLGVIADRDGQTWFLKMIGPYDLVEAQKAAFDAWVQSVRFPDATYDVSLRFKRMYKPYSVQLLDVRQDVYLGTRTASNYSSDIRLIDPTRNVDRKIHIWMNNPLRYAGETFYQSTFNQDQAGVEVTGLQVVTNTGWMIPYVACMIVVVGLAFQFGLTLLRFLNRRQGESASGASRGRPESAPSSHHADQRNREPARTSDEGTGSFARYFPVLVVLLFAGWLLSKARPAQPARTAMNLYEFGQLPVVYQGRVKPLDTLARNNLRIISDKQTFVDENGQVQPAVRWLADLIADPEQAASYRIIRIQNPEVLEIFGLKPRKGMPVKGFLGIPRYPQKLRYALEELLPKEKEFGEQVRLARSVPAEELSTYQRKVLDLEQRWNTYRLMQLSFHAVPFPELPTERELNADRSAALEQVRLIKFALERAQALDRMLQSAQPPLAVPVLSDESDQKEKPWKPFATAWTEVYVDGIAGREPNRATLALNEVFTAYGEGNARAFNEALDDYRALLKAERPEMLHLNKTDFESYFNHLQLFPRAAAFYLAAFLLAVFGWLGWSRPLHRAAFWLIAFTLVVHTIALIARVYISGRPPVTNLYSSAVFIGWGAVVFGMIFEVIYRMGIGSVIASVAGFATLVIANLLAGDGDTFTVLVAVLDTQFWLATHVVCITLGYATTFVAGLLGILYIVLGVATPMLSAKLERDLSRMIYGTVCFALFFSFFGTVLGGLWADDSWGRFWGWDPKENGALIIVLWNALVLHARWDGMARQRGLAILAVGGNIATSWSWFGVNELGVGLHSYGFTEGVLMALGLFVLSQLIVIAAGALPKELWWSFKRRGLQETG